MSACGSEGPEQGEGTEVSTCKKILPAVLVHVGLWWLVPHSQGFILTARDPQHLWGPEPSLMDIVFLFYPPYHTCLKLLSETLGGRSGDGRMAGPSSKVGACPHCGHDGRNLGRLFQQTRLAGCGHLDV